MNPYHDIRRFPRQVHLDFHTSPFIPDVGADFDPDVFADTFAKAKVNSVTIFAKCHHGMCYYPTKHGVRHPNLQRADLLGEMIEALHRRGIRAPIYTTIGWEEDVATRYPQWRQMNADGKFVRNTADNSSQPGAWQFNNFIHPEYQDYIEAHVDELLGNYPIDGLFFDILFFNPKCCWSEQSVRFRERHGLMDSDDQTHARFETAAQLEFTRRFTRQIHSKHPGAGIFYNMPNSLNVDHNIGTTAIAPFRTHWEIESLPSGFWGYYHFPRLGRMAMQTQKPWIGQTGRFQRMWGDFGGIKPQPALEFECFRSQALGGLLGVGDQLHPRGTLDAAAYRLIGAVYEQCEKVEPFYEGSKSMPQVGIVVATGPTADLSLEGAVQMCEESHYDAAVINDSAELKDFELVILPDSTIITPPLRKKLRQYLKGGGKLLASFRGGFDQADEWALKAELPIKFLGAEEKYPTYWRARKNFAEDLSISDRVFYEQGLKIQTPAKARVLVDRVLPYFRRTDLKFCSHFQTPASPVIDPHPAAIGGKNWVYFADPIFREYRQTGNLAARDGWRAAVQQLIGRAPFGEGLPSTVLIYPRRRKADLILTLLHYIPLRKAIDVDMIEERMTFAGEILRFDRSVREVKEFGSGKKLKRSNDGGFVLPAVKGRLLLEVDSLR